MSHFWPLQRDRERLVQLSRRVAVLPLGCGALAGTPIPVDRHELAYLLGFERPAQNSIDSISDRDFAAEVLFCAAMIGIHLSRLAETVVLYSSMEFGFFELSDAYSTGSSLMPQKKNPDMFELARGKAAVLVGQLTGMLTMLKGLPSTYDKDLQEDKPPVFHAVDTLLIVLPVLAGALDTIMVRPERMRAAIDAGMMATDLADYLVGKGIPFREAHALTGKAVRLAMEKGVALDSLPLEDFHSLCECFEADVYQVFDPLVSVKRRKAYGGTAPEAVAAQIEEAKLAMKGG
jgi:argininosuccinate lyase